ncbi:MAG: WecB/TagA/CpsF family glycosyltransferase [Clostridia bacterium]|nr:WecB/TagA/CpsF family glycosyltransferase [Clostridia bacterium]
MTAAPPEPARDRRAPRDVVEVLGVPVDRVAFPEAVARAARLVASGEGGLVVTANPEMVMAARRDGELREALLSASLVVADGVGIVWAAGRLGRPLPGRVAGIELLSALLERAEGEGWPVYFLGARPGVVERAVEAIAGRFPGLVVAGWRDGYFPLESAREVAEHVRGSGARLLVLAMGVPREQAFWWRARRELRGIAVLGVGGSLDVWAGVRRRAPEWMRRRNLEWLFRLVSEPRRIRRQLALPSFALAVLRAKARHGAGDRARGSPGRTGAGAPG